MFVKALFLLTLCFGVSNLKLQSLVDASVKTIDLASEKPSVFVVFQKDCQSCRKQVKELSCLKQTANVFLIGAFSSEADLRKEYRSFGSDFLGLYGDQDFKKMFKITERITPQIIISESNKATLSFGMRPCEKILQQLKGELLK